MKKFSKSRSAYPAKKSSSSAKPGKSNAGANRADSKNRGAQNFKTDRPAKKYATESKAENKPSPYGKSKFTPRKNSGSGSDEHSKWSSPYTKKTGHSDKGSKKFGTTETSTSRNKPTPYGKPKFTKRKDAGASSEEYAKPAYIKKTGYGGRGDKRNSPSETTTNRHKSTRSQADSPHKKNSYAPAYGRKERISKSDKQYRSGVRNKYTSFASPIEAEAPPVAGKTRLNKFIANAGICSRRDADKLITAGLVSVNGNIVTEMGYQVNAGDDVRYNGTRLNNEKKVYLIMNKTRDTITTLDDPEGRKTVTEALAGSGLPRVYPVGRLDRNTTGVLLLTNDGEMAQRLMHPKYEVQKIYKATLDKNLKGQDLWSLSNGIELEDGPIKPDSIAVPNPQEKNVVVIEIHSGRNRIVHRTFEHLGYKVDKLDRIWYAGFDKRALKRGQWRELNERELTTLKKLVKLK
ncbi:MAG: pseudouridine synthase [Bacteroidota bacterium]